MNNSAKERSIYDIEVTHLNKSRCRLSFYKGSVLLLVNVASQCGMAEKLYAELSSLLVKYGKKGLKILLFPCNQYLTRECSSRKQFQDFAAKYSDEFILMDEVNVRGSRIHPLFTYLNEKITDFIDSEVKCSFTYFLIGRNGEFIKRYLPTGAPIDNDVDLAKCIGNVPNVQKISKSVTKLRKNFDSDSTE